MTKVKTTFGLPSLTKQTPEWAKWVFRFTFVFTTVAAFVVSADPGIPDPLKVRIGVYLKAFDMLIYGVSKLFGEQKYSYTEMADK